MSVAGSNVCKLILLGNGSVGKTSICARFVDDGFQRVYKQTVGLDFFEKTLTIRGDKTATLQVWDIGGQQIGSKMLKKYIYGANAVFVCYDVTDASSFADCEDWLGFVRRATAVSDDVPGDAPSSPRVFLVGNKIDLMHLRKVTPEQHERFIEENGLQGGFFISAQSGEAVLTAFYQVAAETAGITLTAHELAFTERVLGVSVVAGGDEGMDDEIARKIEEEDRAAEEAKRRREEGGCNKCAIM
mmetsp:Transcript_21186/g.74706  ORF Transcript_21186/g.74706 Transcript_21186/m.74706 type:complete len:244 (-) Transcript_21186:153-884(-)